MRKNYQIKKFLMNIMKKSFSSFQKTNFSNKFLISRKKNRNVYKASENQNNFPFFPKIRQRNLGHVFSSKYLRMCKKHFKKVI